MPDHVISSNQSATFFIVTLLAICLRPSSTLCETRCEQSIPSLYRLRAYWSRSFKRVGDQLSFEQFLLSLVQESRSDDEMIRSLRSSLLRIIGRYQDCVMACEHQFSKRAGLARTFGRKLKALSKVSSLSRRTTLLQLYLSAHPDLPSWGSKGISHHVT